MGAPCRLCGARNTSSFAIVRSRDYFRCDVCDLVFLAVDQLPSLEEERAEYNLHNNNPNDAGYRKHLAKLTTPLLIDVSTSAKGLDFGCGPGPTISVMLGEQGYEVANYDPVFFRDESVLTDQYDFISCTEVAEHFHNPADNFERLAGLLKPGGKLGIMTAMFHKDIDFTNWYYIGEISHVAFYSRDTMDWIAARYDWQVEVFGRDVVIFR